MLFTGFARDNFAVYSIFEPHVHPDPTCAKSNVIISIDPDAVETNRRVSETILSDWKELIFKYLTDVLVRQL